MPFVKCRDAVMRYAVACIPTYLRYKAERNSPYHYIIKSARLHLLA